MVGWHHRLDGHEFEQASEVGDGHGSRACYSPWGHKDLDMNEWLNWTEIINKSNDGMYHLCLMSPPMDLCIDFPEPGLIQFKSSCFWTVELEKTLESPLDWKEIQPVHFKGDQSWVFTGRTDAEAETPILWPPHAKSWLIGKDPDAGRDWGQEEKETTEDEMARWHHWLGHDWVTELNWMLLGWCKHNYGFGLWILNH